MIDPVTNWTEIIRINNKSSQHVAQQFENGWLSRYPRPRTCVHDQGGEFIGHQFQRTLQRSGVISVPTSVKNPQSNAICERLHQTVTNALRPLLRAHPPENVEDANQVIDTALQTAAYSARVALHRSLKHSPGALVFHRDMILDIPVIADFQLIRERRQVLIDERLHLANRSRISHDYQPGESVLIRAYDPAKLDERAEGPFPIERVHANGTVTIRRSPYVAERINFRRLKPYRS